MAAGATYEPIATTTVTGSAAATISFSSIPSTYTDIVCILTGRITGASTSTVGIIIRFNGDSATNYSQTTMYGDGTNAASYRYSTQNCIFSAAELAGGGTSSNIVATSKFILPSYAGSTNKNLMAEISADLNGSGYVMRNIGLWRNTSAISSFVLTPNANSFAIGTTATLYGIKAA